MSISSILRKQWADYPQIHSTRVNFIVHLITVPVFMAGTVALFWGLCVASISLFVLGVLAMMVALAAQGWGHKQEPQAPAPFTSKANALGRLLLEQWVTFPKYVLHRAGLFRVE